MAILRNNNKILKQNFKFPSVGNGLKFDGVNDYVETNSAINVTTESNSIAIILKFNSTTLSQSIYINQESPGVPFGMWIYTLNNEIYIQRGRGASSGGTSHLFTINTSLVYNFVFVYNSDLTSDLYINGVIQNRNTNTINGSCISNLPFKIGRGQPVGVGQFNGIIYDLKQFSKSLTQSEVTTLYKSNNNLIPNSAYPNLVLNYSFNQKNTPVLANAVLDSSGNGFHGNLINYATPSDVTLGASNSWVDENGNSILT